MHNMKTKSVLKIGCIFGIVTLFSIILVGNIFTDDSNAEETETISDNVFIYSIIDEGNKTARIGDDSDTSGNGLVEGRQYSGSLTIPSYITINEEAYEIIEIGQYAFASCPYLSSVTFETDSHIYLIGERSFFECIDLTDVEFPDSLVEIGDFSFNGCTALVSIVLPDNIEEIGEGCFCCTFNVKSIVFSTSLTVLPWEVFNGCGVSSVVIPENITSIGIAAFANCNNLKKVEMSNTVTDIGAHAFACCQKLSDINISTSVSIINGSTFSSTALKSIVIPDSVIEIDTFAFSGNTSLESVTISNNVQTIEDYAFGGCDNLSTVTVTGCTNGHTAVLTTSNFGGSVWRLGIYGPENINTLIIDTGQYIDISVVNCSDLNTKTLKITEKSINTTGGILYDSDGNILIGSERSGMNYVNSNSSSWVVGSLPSSGGNFNLLIIVCVIILVLVVISIIYVFKLRKKKNDR